MLGAAAVLVVVAATVVLFALTLAWSGALRKDNAGTPDKLPVLSEQHRVLHNFDSVAVTDDKDLWAVGSGGLGTRSDLLVRTLRNGEAVWQRAGELSQSDWLLEVREPYRRKQSTSVNLLGGVVEGADTLAYAPARDAFVWSNRTSGRLFCTVPQSVTYEQNGVLRTDLDPYRKGKVLYHLDRVPLSVAVSPDAKWIAVGMEGDQEYPEYRFSSPQDCAYGSLILLRWGDQGCELAYALDVGVWHVGACSFSQDGRFLVSGGNDSKVRVWSISGGNLVAEWPASAPVTGISAGANADRIVYCSERGHVELRTRDGNLLQSYTHDFADPPQEALRSFRNVAAALSPCGGWLAVLSNGEVRIINMSDNEVVAHRRLPGDQALDVVWSANGKYIGVAMGDYVCMLEASFYE